MISLHDFIEKCPSLNILVLGDLMLDRFIWGKVNRISPEAPVPVVRVTEESSYPGGAANVARNLCQFNVNVFMGGLIGPDLNGEQLLQLLKSSRVDTGCILIEDSYSTIVKTRIIARQQQVVRVDREKKIVMNEGLLRKLADRLQKINSGIDAVIIEDYGKGFINQEVIRLVLETFPEAIISVDPNTSNPLDYSGVTIVKPNRSESLALARIADEDESVDMVYVGELLLRKWRIKQLLITLGEEGMLLFNPPDKPYHSPTKAREVYDVSGAGDTTIAMYTAAIAAGFSPIEATEIANHAAGVVVGKLGTATLTPQELVGSFRSDNE